MQHFQLSESAVSPAFDMNCLSSWPAQACSFFCESHLHERSIFGTKTIKPHPLFVARQTFNFFRTAILTPLAVGFSIRSKRLHSKRRSARCYFSKHSVNDCLEPHGISSIACQASKSQQFNCLSSLPNGLTRKRKFELQQLMVNSNLDPSGKKRQDMIEEIQGHYAAQKSKPAPPDDTIFSDVLRFGKSDRPSVIAIMFHGLHSNAWEATDGIGDDWAKQFDGLFVAPQAPDAHRSGRGYDWFQQEGLQNTQDHLANIKELRKVVHYRAAQVNAWLDKLLIFHNVSDDRLVLVGQSQGSILATVCGASRGCRAVVALGGPTGHPIYCAKKGGYIGGVFIDYLSHLPIHTRTKFCLINGTKDGCVRFQHMDSMLREFNCTWYFQEGAGHDFNWPWFYVAIEWINSLMQGKKFPVNIDGVRRGRLHFR